MEILSLEEAAGVLLRQTERITEVEEISLWKAGKRVLAEEMTAAFPQPPFPRSPLDGYALRSADIVGTSKEDPAELRVIDEVMAGQMSRRRVREKEAVRIMTGAPIPEGADCVIRQEDTNYGEETVQVYEPVGHFQNYCFAGEDYQAGETLLKEGTLLGMAEIGVLASLGRETVRVYKRPRIALFTTGDELVLPGNALTDGKIYDSNIYTLGSRLLEWGMELVEREHLADEAVTAAKRIREVAGEADLVITTGGVSVGKKDIMHEVLKELECERLFWRIAIKPGMPTLCAKYRGKLLICLSGNPFGAAVNLELLVRPVLARLGRREDLKIKKHQAVLLGSFLKASRVTRYVRAVLEEENLNSRSSKTGRTIKARIPAGSNASGILSSMCGCNCLIEIPAGTKGLSDGDLVEVVML